MQKFGDGPFFFLFGPFCQLGYQTVDPTNDDLSFFFFMKGHIATSLQATEAIFFNFILEAEKRANIERFVRGQKW